VANTQHTVNVKDAATGTADVLNVELQSASDLNAGTLTAAEVETVNLKATDTNTSSINNDSLTLTANKATSVNITGNAHLTLTLTGSTKVTSIDASSGYTGNLTVTSLNTTSATTIKGGSGNDVLTAATGTTADKLFGGAGDDVLTANAGLTEMTGGAGRDTFVINTASLNVNSYATILDFTKDDLIKLDVKGGVVGFAASKVTLAPTAVFQDYANAAMNALNTTAANGSLAAWFQYGGDTYIVVDEATTDSSTFINGEDFIVKIAGLVDLSQASFNDTHGTIALV
jgi:S-layer protein